MSKAKNKYQPSASYRGGILTIDLPNATSPVLWRQEIRDVSRISFTLQLLPSGEHALILRANDGAEQVIATFRDKAAADEALTALRDTLLNPQSGLKKALRILWRVIKWMLILLLIIFGIRFAIYFYFNMKISEAVEQNMTAEQAAVTETAPAAETLPPQGVPLVADDYLQAPDE